MFRWSLFQGFQGFQGLGGVRLNGVILVFGFGLISIGTAGIRFSLMNSRQRDAD